MARPAIFAIALFATALSTAAFADSGSDAEQRACRRDVAKHCRAVMNDSQQRVVQCLLVNAASISRGCQQVLRNHGQL